MERTGFRYKDKEGDFVMPQAGYAQLSHYQKLYMKEMLEKGFDKITIAEKLHVSKGTVYNELKRGTVNGVYNPDYSENRRQSFVRRGSAISKDETLARYISYLILEKHMSPQAITKHLKEDNHGFEKYPSSPQTIYTAIEEGLIPNVTKETLNNQVNACADNITTVHSGTITIPKAVREELNIKDGDKYQFECRKNGSIVLRKIKK